MADMQASLSVSLDLSAAVEEAVRSAVCSVLSEIQRLIGKDVAELRAAVARRDCENQRLRGQLEAARRELRARRGGPLEHPGGSHPSPGRGSLAPAPDWDALARREKLKPDPAPGADAADSGPNLVSGPESLVADPTARRHRDPDPDDSSAAMDLRVVEVKEEVEGGQQLSAAAEPAPPTRLKPYICGDCGKSYLWLKNLKKHQKIHTGEAPFGCKVCCRHFSSQQVLEEHQRVHTGERPHQCTYCPKTFNHQSNLKKHQLIHTGEKPHHCSLCGKHFRQIQHLKEHRKTHEDSKPFRCWECGWGFNHGSNFKRHLLVHTRQKLHHGLGT